MYIFYIEYGYISSLDSILSEDNSTVTFTCHLPCQTDFITGCNVTLMNACREEFTKSCIVTDTSTFSPRQCSVVFENLTPSSYEYTAKPQSDNVLRLEVNILNMTGSFVTSGKLLATYVYHSITHSDHCYVHIYS